MCIKTSLILVSKRYLGPTIFVLMVLSSGMVYVWSQYKELLQEQKLFREEIVRSEKSRADSALELIAKKAELDKRQFILENLEASNKEKLAQLEKRVKEYEVVFGKLQRAQLAVSQEQRQKEIEDKIHNLMSQFSAMGVDLNYPVRCQDAEGRLRYNAAKSKYVEIYALAEANEMTQKFLSFFSRNGQVRVSACVQ